LVRFFKRCGCGAFEVCGSTVEVTNLFTTWDSSFSQMGGRIAFRIRVATGLYFVWCSSRRWCSLIRIFSILLSELVCLNLMAIKPSVTYRKDMDRLTVTELYTPIIAFLNIVSLLKLHFWRFFYKEKYELLRWTPTIIE
jgi:hypothetical protein